MSLPPPNCCTPHLSLAPSLSLSLRLPILSLTPPLSLSLSLLSFILFHFLSYSSSLSLSPENSPSLHLCVRLSLSHPIFSFLSTHLSLSPPISLPPYPPSPPPPPFFSLCCVFLFLCLCLSVMSVCVSLSFPLFVSRSFCEFKCPSCSLFC